MIQFTRLRINGFKSFAERTELEIGAGLNGVVGPNGCGKSNLIESLRWVMGESSAKRMRGEGMEDVIFNGTAKRPARNIAEVSLLINNSAHTAPAPYNNLDEIEITRRIERDKGSTYKINGRTVRARDVQMLFADTVSGANSPSMVSQGRVTQMINAKPLDRRLILEESAGISGLYARRHEAELRLKAADANLERIEDITGSMETRLAALKRQARQAVRYRNLNAQIRQLELLIAYGEWKTLEEKEKAQRLKFAEAESRVSDKLILVNQLTKTLDTQSKEITPLRTKDAEIAASLQVQKLALERLEDEQENLNNQIEDIKAQLTRTTDDHAHETQTRDESQNALTDLEGEHERLLKTQETASDDRKDKETALEACKTELSALEEHYNALMASAAETRAHRASLEQQIKQNEQRAQTLRTRLDDTNMVLGKLEDSEASHAEQTVLTSEIKGLKSKLETTDEEIEQTTTHRDEIKTALEDARTAYNEGTRAQAAFESERSTLEALCAQAEDGDFTTILDQLTTDEGFEKALSRALGDALLGGTDEEAPARWAPPSEKLDLPALPSALKALSPHIKAPAPLKAALSQIGLAEDEEQAKEALADLKVGQSIVSRNGAYWRWDGYQMSAAATDRNALHLEHKNKLRALEEKAPNIHEALEKAEQTLQSAEEQIEQSEAKLNELRSARTTTQNEIEAKTKVLNKIEQDTLRTQSERTRLEDQRKTTQDDLNNLNTTLATQNEQLAELDEQSNGEDQNQTLDKAKSALHNKREDYQNALSAFERLQQEENTRKARLHAIADERVSLKNRAIRAGERLKELETRRTELQNKYEALTQKPDNFEDQKQALLDKCAALETERTKAATRLQDSENELNETNKALKEAERLTGEAREARAHAQATLDSVAEQMAHMRSAIGEKFDLSPQELAVHAAVPPEGITEDKLLKFKKEKEQLTRDRESLGAVNLRADIESQELEKELSALLNERNDLVQAIEELRSGIQKINKEARERLKVAFDHVNAHFQSLFTRLFGGGQAHLALIDSDDPLAAGLEVFAQPPGKSLQSLSLLSGGEQTLASIALIFAMFLTNPAPICVLDEIDAPLDDANVDRVCDLLDEITQKSQTRFVIISHHRLTMARMDRLYGVTMAERGISQLVSVDLQQSFNFLDEAA